MTDVVSGNGILSIRAAIFLASEVNGGGLVVSGAEVFRVLLGLVDFNAGVEELVGICVCDADVATLERVRVNPRVRACSPGANAQA